MLLFPDPRPLVERLGVDFFRQAPECPGVYLMRDAADTVLYVGKAKNLRKRLASYRVANPDRMPRRHLRLLRAVARIELQECASEACALAKESELLRNLKPRFNRAGTWPGMPRFLSWRMTDECLAFVVAQQVTSDWSNHGPLGSSAFMLRAVLVRLLWCAIHQERGLAGMPQGWFRGRHGELVTIPRYEIPPRVFEDLRSCLVQLFAGHTDEFVAWVQDRTLMQNQPFEVTVREADLEFVTEFAARWRDMES
ncbi:MAG TPA: nucleotide excision repair endonuclease [Clostridia bacterium]|nr:nucleotide excision repair endonuclease [Clostridia bacterium]